MPDLPPDRPDDDPTIRLLLRVSGILFVVSLAFILLDVVLGVHLPRIVRPMLPWALLASMLVGATLLVGLLGMPKRPDRDE